MCTYEICEACHCNFDKSELVNNLCSECTEIIELLEPLGFIETEFNKNAQYWIVTDDFNKFVPIIFEDDPLSEIYKSILHCKELIEIKKHLLGCHNEELENLERLKLDYFDILNIKMDYKKELVREIARFKWFDKYKNLLPYMADMYQIFDFNNADLKEMIEKNNQFLKSNNLI